MWHDEVKLFVMSKANKCKLINKQGIARFVMHSVKGQQLNEREVYTINNQSMDGLLQIGVVKKGNGFELIYNLSGLVSLHDFLINPLNRESFARILQNILDVLKAMQTVFFNQRCLIMEFDRVMVNPATQKLMFIYVPIQNYDSRSELRTFLLDIIQACTFVKEEDSNYVREYIRILNDGINFSIFELEEYIKGLVSETGYRLEKTVKCFKCGSQVNIGNNFCPICGAKITGNVSEINNAIYDPLDKPTETVIKEPSKQQDTGRRTEAPNSGGLSETQGLSSKVFEQDCGDTMLLGMYESMYDVERYLIREKTGEKIQITKDSFRLGKSVKKCDYAVSDNPMVSREHADIVKQEDGYYIVDLESTNKTYVDNCVVVNQKEIHSGSKIKLANEIFTFHSE